MGHLRDGVTRALQSDDVEGLLGGNTDAEFELQSTDEITADLLGNKSEATLDHGPIHFVDESPGQIEEFVTLQDRSYLDNYKADAGLADFLSRPVLLKSYTWTEGAAIDQSFKPWADFFNNAIIKNKLENYNFLNCSLKLKILINASPFYYGLCGVFYTPMVNFFPTSGVSAGTEGTKSQASTKPHVWIYPQNSQGAEFKLPFFYHKNWLDITSLTDFQNMGSINVKSFTNLLNANSVAGTDCDIQIYGWAEDLCVCGPTYNAALQSSNVMKKKKEPRGGAGVGARKVSSNTQSSSNSFRSLDQHQSQKGGDHYEHAGTISKPASAIARAAGVIAVGSGAVAAASAETPIGVGAAAISEVAAGVSGVASTVANVAESFGYTNTPNIEGVSPYKSLPFHSMSSAEISQPIEKLTLDPKNELIIDGTTTGITGKEELSIDSLARREAYLATFTWAASDAAGDLLWGSVVSPDLMISEGTTPEKKYTFTPMAMLNHMFSYWRGDIVFRLRFIASKYHRGRVRITWDPTDDLGAVSDTNTSNYNMIVDINECPDVRVKVPYLQATSFLNTRTGLAEYFDDTTLTAPVLGFDNGQISVRVLTQQTSPVASADISVVVSVYAENLEYAAPKEITPGFAFYDVQSTDITGDFPENVTSAALFEQTVAPSELNEVYMGETITSVKQLLRRHTYVGSNVYAADTTSRYCLIGSERNRYPLFYGYDTDGVQTADDIVGVGTSPFNFVAVNYFSLIAPCFVASRGSVSWMFNAVGSNPVAHFRVIRRHETVTAANYNTKENIALSLSNDATERALLNITSAGMAGQSLTHQLTQTGLATVIPMYNRYRFRNNSKVLRTLGLAADDSDVDTFRVEAYITPDNGQRGDDTRIDSYFAIGSDFDLHFFLSVPAVAEQVLPTAP